MGALGRRTEGGRSEGGESPAQLCPEQPAPGDTAPGILGIGLQAPPEALGHWDLHGQPGSGDDSCRPGRDVRTPSRGALGRATGAAASSLELTSHPGEQRLPAWPRDTGCLGGLSPGQRQVACVSGLPVTQSRLCHKTARGPGSAVTQVPVQPTSWGRGRRQRPLSPAAERSSASQQSAVGWAARQSWLGRRPAGEGHGENAGRDAAANRATNQPFVSQWHLDARSLLSSIR